RPLAGRRPPGGWPRGRGGRIFAAMDPMFKWIGGATAALVLLLGGAMLASEMWGDPQSEDAPSLEEAIPVDAAGLAMPGAAEPEGAADPASTPAPDREAFVLKRILPIEGPIKYGDWYWDDEGVPEGPLVVTVDLEARVISVFRNGYEIGAAAAMLGTPEHP